jgi:hypothetical protein
MDASTEEPTHAEQFLVTAKLAMLKNSGKTLYKIKKRKKHLRHAY